MSRWILYCWACWGTVTGGMPLRLLTPACAPFWRRLGRRVSWRWLRGGLPLCLSWRWIWSLSMCLGLCVLGCLCQLAVLLGQYWALGNASVRSATRGGGWVLWCSVRRACVGSTGRVVVLPVHSRCEIGCVARVRWWCLSLLLVLFVILFFFESRILTCLTYTSRRGSQHRGQTAEQEDTKARKAKLQRPRTAAQGSLSHKQQAQQANKGPDRTLEL